MSQSQLVIRHQHGLGDVDTAQWNRLNREQNPFLSHEYLHGLETTGCLQPEGWLPRHITVELNGQLVAAMPLYLRSNSYGEFVFDWAWAEAFERAGGRYYPKLVSAIPFSPVRGQRLLVDDTFEGGADLRRLMIEQVIDSAETANLSSFHCLFPVDEEVSVFTGCNLLKRKGFQFHWHNHAYCDFDDFLDGLTSKKRKQIRRERRQAVAAGISVEVLSGNEISDEQWQVFYDFYCATFYRRWGNPRLTTDFFRLLSEKMPAATLLILARQNGKYVAGAFAMLGKNTLYGRHWGCSRELPFLHFELCYYQTIDYCINKGLAVLDAGVQGEHKLSRGFDPVATWSCHWIQHPGFRASIEDFLRRETRELDTYIDKLNRHLPYKTPAFQHDEYKQRSSQ